MLEDGRIRIEGISATSAGSMNAVVTAYGNMTGGRGGARAALYNFWKKISEVGAIYFECYGKNDYQWNRFMYAPKRRKAEKVFG